jgi:hypothetical protein
MTVSGQTSLRHLSLAGQELHGENVKSANRKMENEPISKTVEHDSGQKIR